MGDDPLPQWRQVLVFLQYQSLMSNVKVFINLREGFGDR